MAAKNTKKSKEDFAYGKQFNEETFSSNAGTVELQSTKEGAVFSALPGTDTSAILSGSVSLPSSTAFTAAIESDEDNENLAELSITEDPIETIVNKDPIEASVDEDFAYKPLDS